MQKTSKTDITEEIKGESTYKNRSLRNVLPLILSHIYQNNYSNYIKISIHINYKKGKKEKEIKWFYFFFKYGSPVLLLTPTTKSGSPCDKPDNMAVGINKRTGLPYLKKK